MRDCGVGTAQGGLYVMSQDAGVSLFSWVFTANSLHGTVRLGFKWYRIPPVPACVGLLPGQAPGSRSLVPDPHTTTDLEIAQAPRVAAAKLVASQDRESL